MKPKVIIIGSADVIKLGFIRLVGQVGYPVIVIHIVKSYKSRTKPIDYYSKYVSSYYFSKSDDLVTVLLEKCTDENNPPFLFPLDDSSVCSIDYNFQFLKSHFRLSHINHEGGAINICCG